MKLIENAKKWYRMAVLQVAFGWSAAIAAWPMLTESQRSDVLSLLGIPPNAIGGVTALLMFLTLLGARLTKQDALHKPSETHQ